MAERDNPAGRLLTLLTHSRAYAGGDLTIQRAWCPILGVESEDDLSELVVRLSKVLELPTLIEVELDLVDFDTTAFTVPLASLRRVLPGLLLVSHPVQNFNQQITEAMLVNLDNCSALLHGIHPERVLGDNELELLRESITELQLDVLEASLPGELEQFLVRQLSGLVSALDTYAVTGVADLEDAFLRSIGALVTKPEMRDAVAKKKPELWSKLAKILAGVGLLFATANQGTELVHSWFPELPPAQVQPTPPASPRTP